VLNLATGTVATRMFVHNHRIATMFQAPYCCFVTADIETGRYVS